MSEEILEQQIGNVPISPEAEPNKGSIPGVSGKKEAEYLAAETNKHHREMLKLERGLFGRLFGNAAWAPTNIGGFALVASFIFVGISFCFTNTTELNEARKWAYAIASGAMGFLFGSAKSKN